MIVCHPIRRPHEQKNMNLRTSVFSVTTLSFHKTRSQIIIQINVTSIFEHLQHLRRGDNPRWKPSVRNSGDDLWTILSEAIHIFSLRTTMPPATLGNVTKAIRCYNIRSIYIWNFYIPPKTNMSVPWKIVVGKLLSFFEMAPFLPDTSVFWGAYFYVKPW